MFSPVITDETQPGFSINYFDRFLSAHELPETGWAFQLLAVASLSLAAKMEELSVPLLLDLQRLGAAYVFDADTVQRMELLVLAKLDWNLRSVTPFDYLDYFIARVPSPFGFQLGFHSSSPQPLCQGISTDSINHASGEEDQEDS